MGERRVEPLGSDRDRLTREPERGVPQQGTGHEAGLGEHLEAVADPEHETALGGERADGTHHRAEPGDDTSPDVIAVGEPTGQDDSGDAIERHLLMPEGNRVRADESQRVERVPIAVAPREDDDADPDRTRSGLPGTSGRRRSEGDADARAARATQTSISGFDRRSRREPLDDRARRRLRRRRLR